MQRRSFLRRASVLPLPLLLNQVKLSALTRPFFASAMNDDDRVLVLLQLSGGNDGLNTVIPLDQYDGLMAVRGDLVIPEARVLQAEDTIGFHPAMTGIQEMYDAGQVAVVQGVGYPGQNRSHFRSTDILHTASDSDEILTSGWLGRHLDDRYPGYPAEFPNDDEPDPFAIVMGSSVSETCQGRAANFSIALANVDNVGQLPVFEGSAGLDTPYGVELDWLRTTIAQSNQYATGIEAAVAMGNSLADYPDGNVLAGKLRDVARLISGGLRTKIYIVELGGFDTHAGQTANNDSTVGTHADLLTTLSDAVAAFQADLIALGLEKRVIGMTYSEFGRRIKANGSQGTDHGDAAPLFLFGNCVQGGITGSNAEVPADVGNGEGVALQYDFRNVYGSVLMDWFGVGRQIVSDILLDDFAYIPIVADCNATTSTDSDRPELRAVDLNVVPNPVKDVVTVSFTTGSERVHLSVFDTYGRQVKRIADRHFSAGEHRVEVSMGDLPNGAYFIHLMLAGGLRTSKRVVKGR